MTALLLGGPVNDSPVHARDQVCDLLMRTLIGAPVENTPKFGRAQYQPGGLFTKRGDSRWASTTSPALRTCAYTHRHEASPAFWCLYSDPGATGQQRHRQPLTVAAESLPCAHPPVSHSDIFNISNPPELKQNLNFNRSPVCPVYFSPGTI